MFFDGVLRAVDIQCDDGAVDLVDDEDVVSACRLCGRSACWVCLCQRGHDLVCLALNNVCLLDRWNHVEELIWVGASCATLVVVTK